MGWQSNFCQPCRIGNLCFHPSRSQMLQWLVNLFPLSRKKVREELQQAKRKLPQGGVYWLAHSYNDCTGPRDETQEVPRQVWIIYHGRIKPAILMRVPKHVPGSPYVGLVGISSPSCLQTFIPMYRVFDREPDAQSFLDQHKDA